MQRHQQNVKSSLLLKGKQREKMYRMTRYLVGTVVSG